MAFVSMVVKQKLFTPTPHDPTTSFEGKTVIVTGATSGLGYEAALKFAKLGASKVILTARDMSKGQTCKALIEAKKSSQVMSRDCLKIDNAPRK